MNNILITGGTGSFGNAFLIKSLEENNFGEIRIFSRDEKTRRSKKTINSDKVKFYIGDVRDKESIENAVKGVNHIFSCGCIKTGPSCEFFPIEAVKTNILGTNNVLSAAKKYDVSRVVVLSTDKAAYPINTMGMTKALMEKTMMAAARNLNNKKYFLWNSIWKCNGI